jgi:hypothetical protein
MTKIHFILLLLLPLGVYGQFTRQDSLRGGLTPERVWWDLKHYDLVVAVSPETKEFKGSNTITYQVIDTAVSIT